MCDLSHNRGPLMPRAVITSKGATAADPFSSGRNCGGGPFDLGVLDVHVRCVIVAAVATPLESELQISIAVERLKLRRYGIPASGRA